MCKKTFQDCQSSKLVRFCLSETSKLGTYFKKKLSKEHKIKEKTLFNVSFILQLLNLALRLYLRSKLEVSITVKASPTDSTDENQHVPLLSAEYLTLRWCDRVGRQCLPH